MIEDRFGRERRMRLPFVVLAALLLAAVGVGTASALVWQTETVASNGELGMSPSLVLDSADNPHISFFIYSDELGAVGYARGDGTSWFGRVLGYDEGYNTCLALDHRTRPHITYFCPMAFAVKYSWWSEGSWQTETVSGEDFCKFDSSLALDDSDNPRISYATLADYSSPGAMRYTAYDGSNWHTSTVDRTGGGDSSLALDSYGAPRIAYIGTDPDGNSALKFAMLDGSEWKVEIVDSGVSEDSGLEIRLSEPSLALDGADRPRIAYTEWSAGKARLKYAAYDGTAWTVDTVDAAGSVGSSPSLALNAAGYPRISYGDLTMGDLKYAWSDGSVWHSEVVDAARNVGECTSLALDSAGYPRIAYYDTTNADLKYARGIPTVQAIGELRPRVVMLGLPATIQTGLTDKLDAVAAALDRNSKRAAINTLSAFMAQVKAQTGKTLTAAQAEGLIAEAKRIVAAI